jgi:hypothetical protein
MDDEKIIQEYLHFTSTTDIAEKYGLTKEKVRSILRSKLPKNFIIRIGRIIGARSVSEKLKDPIFKSEYVKKMKVSVSNSLRERMKDDHFKEHWVQKTRLASTLGNKKIRTLLKNDAAFSKNWSERCSIAGRVSRSSEKGIFDPKRKKDRTKWSILGLQKTGRKCTGPLGENMYNYLETCVAKDLLLLGLTYQYEKKFPNENLNGFFSVDFIVNEIPLIIEVTYWDKIDKKCAELKRKFSYFRGLFPNHSFIVVTKKSLCDGYKRLLPDNISLLTRDELVENIAVLTLGISGVTNSND